MQKEGEKYRGRQTVRWWEGGEQRLCKITGYRASLVWFSEKTKGRITQCVPVLTPSSMSLAEHQRRSNGEQVLTSSFEQGL